MVLMDIYTTVDEMKRRLDYLTQQRIQHKENIKKNKYIPLYQIERLQMDISKNEENKGDDKEEQDEEDEDVLSEEEQCWCKQKHKFIQLRAILESPQHNLQHAYAFPQKPYNKTNI